MSAATIDAPAGARTGAETDEEEAAKEGITELERITADRVDAVTVPANGTPLLMMKALAAKDGAAQDDAEPEDEVGEPSAEDEAGGDGGSGGGGGAAKGAVPAAGPPSWEDYRKAVADCKATEPSTVGALDATDLLKARAAWNRWNTAAKQAGLDGTRGGYAIWAAAHASDVAKRDFDANVGGGVDRSKLPKSDFVDPKGRRFPVVTPQDVHDAASSYGRAKPLIPFGKFKSRLTSIARRKGEAFVARLPAKWETATAKEALEECLAKSIEAGDLTVEEAAAIAREQAPALEKARAGGGTQPDDTAKADTTSCRKCGKCLTGPVRKCPGCGKKNPLGKRAVPGSAAGSAAMKDAPADPERARETVEKALAAGLISREAADLLLAEVEKRKRPLPATTDPVAAHREPDGSYVEALEADAGLPTDHDGSSDKIPASVMGKSLPYPVLRMHDATCAAFEPGAVLEDYAALKSLPDAVDAAWFAGLAEEAVRAGDHDAALKALGTARAAQFLAAADPAAFADARARLSKAFASMYPDTHLSPSSPRQPGSFQRPYLSAGHASERPGGAPNVPPSSHVPEPQQFGRGAITAGHAARSPGDHAPNTPAPPDAGGRSYYSAGEAAMAQAAMQSVHDHIASTFAGACPMSPSKTQMPPDMGARNVPSSKPSKTLPKDMGGIATVKAAADGDEDKDAPFGGKQAPAFGGKPKKKGGKKKMRKAQITAAAERAARRAVKAVAGTLPDAAALTAAAAGSAQAASGDMASRLAELERLVKELGEQPDPAMAPVRGQIARAVQAGDTGAAPVEKRSPAAEALEKQEADRRLRMAADRAQYLNYLEAQSRSSDPKVALRAEELLEKEMSGS